MILAIRYFFIIFSTLYIYLKILNIHPKNKYRAPLIYTILFSVIMEQLSFVPSTIRLLIIFISFFTFITVYAHTKLTISLTVTIVSFAISIVSLAFASLIISLTFSMFTGNLLLSNQHLFILGGIIQFLFIFLLFKIKRLKNGMPFLYKNSFINGGLMISGSILLFFLLLQHNVPSTRPTYLKILFTLLFLAVALLFWWRKKITQSYIEKVRLGELEALYKNLLAKEHEIQRLQKSNQELDRIIHKDNKLIPAMEFAIQNYLTNASGMTPDEAQEYGANLLTQLQTLSAERKGIINEFQQSAYMHPQIGIASMDAVIQYMEKRAHKAGITYEMKFDSRLKQSIGDYVEESDSLHLLSDLIENAIIAVSHSPGKKKILIHLGFSYNKLFFDIYDSGIPFTIETYQNFGNMRYTTYSDSGGSGIGLMDIWKLKRKYKASLQIYEFPAEEDNYTKKIRILFDHKNHFLLQTYRAKEMQSNIIRNDLYIFPYNEYSPTDVKVEHGTV